MLQGSAEVMLGVARTRGLYRELLPGISWVRLRYCPSRPPPETMRKM
jgi:hypothetical protein